MGKNVVDCHNQSKEEGITMYEHSKKYHADDHKKYPKAHATLSKPCTSKDIGFEEEAQYHTPLQKFLGKGKLSNYTDDELQELKSVIAQEIKEWHEFENMVYEQLNLRAEKWMTEHPNDI